MIRHASQWIVAAVACLFSAHARADVTATITSGQGSTLVEQHASGEWEVTLTKTSSAAPTSYLVTGATTDVIRFVVVNNSSANTASVTVRGPTANDGVAQVKVFTNASSTGPVHVTAIRTVGALGGSSSGEPAIKADSVAFGRIGGDVLHDVIVETGSLDNFVVSGDFLADLSVTGGSIILLDVAGSIGTGSGLVSIDCIASGSGGTIEFIRAAEIHADITADLNVQHIETTTGVFRGSLIADEFSGGSSAGLDVAGDLDADVTVDYVFRPIVIAGSILDGVTFTVNNNVSIDSNGSIQVLDDLDGTLIVGGTLASNRTLYIADAVRGTIDIGTLAGILEIDNILSSSGLVAVRGSLSGAVTIADDGLAGQVIVNAGNLGTPGVWSGTVTVGSIVLGPGQSPPYQSPHYGVLSSALGGGAVGLAPFNLHPADCDPPHGASLGFDPTTTVYLRH